MKISVWHRRDTDGNLCPIVQNGKTYPFIGELTDGDKILVTAWGETGGDVTNQLREHQLKMEGRL